MEHKEEIGKELSSSWTRPSYAKAF
jgi:hypothetical protein